MTGCFFISGVASLGTMRAYSSEGSLLFQLSVAMPSPTAPKKARRTTTANACGTSARFFVEISSASLVGQLLTHERHPVHSGEMTLSFSATAMPEGQAREQALQSMQASGLRLILSGLA